MTSIARRITLDLGGRWHGRYGLALCPAHQNTRTPALSLSDGDAGRLLAFCHAGCSFWSVLEALRYLGLIEGNGQCCTPSAANLDRAQVAKEAKAKQRETQALALWHESQPIYGTLAEQYLRSRGISQHLAETLRFHSDCWHAPSARSWPAMVALIEGGAGLAVHRTYLRPDGSGKAALDPPRMMLGAVLWGAVRLAQAKGPLVVAEGIETALSLACGILDGPATIWSALSASGLAGLKLPMRPHQLIVATDGDQAGRTSGNKLAERAVALGWQVYTLPAPDGCDWNDTLTKRVMAQ